MMRTATIIDFPIARTRAPKIPDICQSRDHVDEVRSLIAAKLPKTDQGIFAAIHVNEGLTHLAAGDAKAAAARFRAAARVAAQLNTYAERAIEALTHGEM